LRFGLQFFGKHLAITDSLCNVKYKPQLSKVAYLHCCFCCLETSSRLWKRADRSCQPYDKIQNNTSMISQSLTPSN